MKDEDFVTKTINEGNVDIQKFPASKVQQLAKKMESSKATAKHIRQVAGDLPAAQIQLMQHQCTKLPARNYPKRKQTSTARQKSQNYKSLELPASWKPFDLQKLDTQSDKCTRCGDTLHAKGFQCPARNFNAKHVTNLDFSPQYVTRRVSSHQARSSLENPQHNKFKQGPCTPITMLIEVNQNCQMLKNHSVYG